MPRRLKTFLVTCLLLSLTACMTRSIKLTAKQTAYDGLVIQSVVFITKQQQHQWVCYTELRAQVITGISCQNDTALPLFSGGLVAGEFEYDYPSRLLLKIQPANMLAYIKISLFDELQYNLSHLSITKQTNQSQIDDHQRKIKLTIQTL